MKKKIEKILGSILITLLFLILGAINSSSVLADASSFQKAKVTLAFDDGFSSVHDTALPILNKYGFKGTVFMVTNDLADYGMLDVNQLRDLQNNYGWEIGSHSKSHPELPIIDFNDAVNEIRSSQEILTQKGFNVTSFASPYGAYDNAILAEILKTYNLQRGFWERGYLNDFPYDRAILVSQSVEWTYDIDTIKGWIDWANNENKWLVLVLHETLEKSEMDPDWEYQTTPQELDEICAYISSLGIEVVTPNHTISLLTENKLDNPSFNNGMNSWTTNDTSHAYIDTGNHGSYPSALNSVVLSGAQNNVHLFSEKVSVSPGTDYAVEIFVNSDNLTGGELGFYMDEYDAYNNWISGKWLGMSLLDRVLYFGRIYTPTSTNVAYASLQTYLVSGNGYAYLDNFKLSPLSQESPPEPTPIPGNNLVANPSFEQLTNNWAQGWIRQNGYAIDVNSNGNDGSNSAMLDSNTRTHLFSEAVTIDNTSTYAWSQFVKAQIVGSEFGFYIDEYNAQGYWISGKWLGMIDNPFTGVINLSYTPTSTNVHSISLQYYSVGGSQSQIFIDSVTLTK